MGSIRILFGRTRWRRRKALQQQELGGIDPFGRPTFLYLTGTHRKRAQVLREFEGRPAFSPEVRVLGAEAARLWRGYGDGRALLTDEALALAARRELSSSPRWAGVAGADGGRALARLEQALAHHGRTAGDPAVEGLVRSLRSRLRLLPDRVRPSEALEGLVDRLALPTPALLGTLRAHETVVVDDIVGSTPLECRLLVSLARAWSAAGVHVVLAFASGRDRGGREAGTLLGWEEGDRELRAFSATGRLRRAVLDELVATGEARVLVAGADELREIEPWTEHGTESPRDLADAFADGDPVTADPGPIRVLRAADPADEVRSVARGIKDALRAGADPRDCLVAVSDPGAVGALAVALSDHGVPYRLGAGIPLGTAPVALAVRRVAGLALDGLGPDLCALAERIGWSSPVDPRTVRRWCVAAGVRAGRPSEWLARLLPWAVRSRSAEEEQVRDAIGALEGLADLLVPLAEDATPEAWVRTLHDTLSRLRVSESCGDDPGELHAWAAVVEAIEALRLDLLSVDPGVWTAAVLREELDRSLADASYDPTPRSVARVPVVGVRELLGLTPVHTWVVGLTAGAFPRARPASFLVGPEEHHLLSPDPLSEGRYLLASLLRDALGEPWMRSVTLSWPASSGGRPVAPSALLAELLEHLQAEEAGDAHGPAAISDAVRRAAADPERWLEVLPEPLRADVLARREAALARTGELGSRDGLLERPPTAPTGMSVTSLETYLRCPARYWYGTVLGLAQPEPWAPELEPRRRGTAIHRILEAFLADRDLRPLSGEPDADGARGRLHLVASRVLDLVEREGGFDPVFQRYARARWLAGLVDDRPAGVLRVWLDAEIGGLPLVPEAVERKFEGLEVGPVTLRGTIDRLDRLPDGTRLVTDYKTGGTPTRRQVELGLSLQPVAYAEAVATSGSPVAASFLSLARPDDLRRTGWTGDPAALDALCTPEERRRALPLDAAGRAEVLGRAAEGARALVAGRFPPTPHLPEVAGCPNCSYRRICRLDPARHGGRGSEADLA